MQNFKIYNIASINVKTQGKNFTKKNLMIGKRNTQILADFIEKENLYSVGTQELTYLHQNELAKLLLPGYVVSGGYRYGNGTMLEKIPYNESNAIVTRISKMSHIVSKTEHIPSVPTIYDVCKTGPIFITKLHPRILTFVVDDYEKIIHINTHLHDAFHKKRVLQEQFILDCVNAIKTYYEDYNIVLTGDFNDVIPNKNFCNFVEGMEEIGFEHVPINQKTYSKQKENIAIDHIFISRDLSLEDFRVCDVGEIVTTTDHYPILAKVMKKGVKNGQFFKY